jgi:hypothetical protein
METMKFWKIAFVMLAAFSLASCSSDEPRYADPEAHEKTVQLNEQYGQLMVGTWHCESISDTQRYFEQLTFNADGTLTGMRKWQFRKLVKTDGEQRYTDWESEDILEGTFSGTWKLRYYSPEGMTGEKRNCLLLNAPTMTQTVILWRILTLLLSTMQTKRRSASKASISKMMTA